jgi:hypothetical protein
LDGDPKLYVLSHPQPMPAWKNALLIGQIFAKACQEQEGAD